MCSVCIASTALDGKCEVYGYEIEAKGDGPEFSKCKYRIKHKLWKKWPDRWKTTDDLAGTISKLGLDTRLEFWTNGILERFKREIDFFKESLKEGSQSCSCDIANDQPPNIAVTDG